MKQSITLFAAAAVAALVIALFGSAHAAPPAVTCLSASERKALVEKSRRNAKRMGIYEHVPACFEAKLLAMSMDKRSRDSVLCADEGAIINALVSCALRTDAVPVVNRANIRDLAFPRPSVRNTFIPYPECGRRFPCCVFAGESPNREQECWRRWCVHHHGC